jgi:hypothetical protein
LARNCSSTKLHIRTPLDGVNGLAAWLPPTQMPVIPGCQNKTPVAQMHFASKHLLSKGSHGINGLWLIIQANSGKIDK